MYNRNLEKLIPIVSKIIQDKIETYKKETDEEKQKNPCHITQKFNGYFASFGPSVLMAGLYQTIYSYHDKAECINAIILEAMQKMGWIEYDIKKLIDVVKKEDNTDILLKNRLLEVIVACKLSIRTFELEED